MFIIRQGEKEAEDEMEEQDATSKEEDDKNKGVKVSAPSFHLQWQ